MSVIKANGAGSAASDFYSYKIDQSLKFNDGDTPALTATFGSAGDRKTWTWSGWVKRTTLGEQDIFGDNTSSSSDGFIKFRSDNTLQFGSYVGSYQFDIRSSAVFRDVSAWYHIVAAYDSANGTAALRQRLYVNGTEVSYGTQTNSSQNDETKINNNVSHAIGHFANSGGVQYFDGYLAEINFIDGTALTPASFGETKDGVWVPKDASGLTFGDNGFYLPFKNDVVSEGFNVVTYLGNDVRGNTIGEIGFAPDLVWIKNRDVAEVHSLYDTVRGATAQLFSSETDAEANRGIYGLTAFTGDGFTLGSGGEVNDANEKYVAWCWEAGGTPTANNSAGAGATPTAGSVKIDGSNLGSALGGSIAATRLSANTSKGFSVVSYTGNGTSGATVAHGLSAAPDWILVKIRSGSSGGTNWRVYHSAINEEHHAVLNNKAGKTGQTNIWNDTAPTSTVFSLGNHVSVNENNSTTIAYCWHDVSGYSKFGSYTGDGSSSNAVTGLGFKPAWLMVKRVDTETTYSNWWIQDSTRNPSNTVSKLNLAADTNAVETTALEVDFDSDGFTLKDASQGSNISSGTYIYMAFADTREAAFFKDASGKGNNFTPTNLQYRDVVPDSPTNSFCTLNSLTTTAGTYSEGNTRYLGASAWRRSNATHGISSGKWYWEYCVLTAPYSSRATNSAYHAGGFCLSTSFNSTTAHSSVTDGVIYTDSGYFKNFSGSYTSGSAGTITSIGDIIGFAVNLEDNTFTVYKNNSSEASGTIGMTAGTEIVPLLLSYNADYGIIAANFGQDSSFSGAKESQGNADGNGIGDFFYAPPSGFLAVCSANLPDLTIGPTTSSLATDNFNTVSYTGNNVDGRGITGVGFSPDWVWIKNRSAANNNILTDTVRGATKTLFSDITSNELTVAKALTAFGSDGFTVGKDSSAIVNASSNFYVSWNWKAGGSASSNSDGSITSSVSANAAAGFSIVSFEGSGSAATVGHGLSAAPEMVIVKNRENASGLWLVYHAGIASDAETDYIHLESNNAAADDNSAWNDTAPTSSVFSVGTSVASNQSGKDIIAYCFHSVEGYSKAASYVGNGSTDGTFVHTGFRPAWILTKTTTVADNWRIHDNKRIGYNPNNYSLYPNLSNSEDAPVDHVDLLSNGFKTRSSNINANGHTYIYFAFAEQPFKFANAR